MYQEEEEDEKEDVEQSHTHAHTHTHTHTNSLSPSSSDGETNFSSFDEEDDLHHHNEDDENDEDDEDEDENMGDLTFSLEPDYLKMIGYSTYPNPKRPCLPSSWNEEDKSILLSMGLSNTQVSYKGNGKSSEAGVIRSNYPIPTSCGIYYFEVEITSKEREAHIAIGFSSRAVPLNKLPGIEKDSYGYHGEDGYSYNGHGNGKHYGPSFGNRDIIGAGINFRTNRAFFTRNGVELDSVFDDLKGPLYPTIGLKRVGDYIKANFGAETFKYDIETYTRDEKARSWKEVDKFYDSSIVREPLAKLEPLKAQELVQSYLQHKGMFNTANIFAKHVDAELDSWKDITPAARLNISDDGATIRRTIQLTILKGDIQAAIDLTNQYFPGVLETKNIVYFRLRVRKFIEMIIEGAQQTSVNGKKAKKRESDVDMKDAYGNGDGSVDRLTQAVEYGQQLAEDYKDDSRPEVQKSIREASALLAYEDPRDSILGYLTEEKGRQSVSDDLNSAILVSLGKQPLAPLERALQHAQAMLWELSATEPQTAFFNINHDILCADADEF